MNSYNCSRYVACIAQVILIASCKGSTIIVLILERSRDTEKASNFPKVTQLGIGAIITQIQAG